MKTPRAVRYGNALGLIIISYASSMPKDKREEYIKEIAGGIERLRFKTKKVGEPLSREHRRALEKVDLSEIAISDPPSFLRVIDEGLQLMYSAQRAREIQRGFLEVLKRLE